MLKRQELIGLIQDSLNEMDGNVTKPDQEGYVSRISVDVFVEPEGVLLLTYKESGQVDRYKITVECI